MNRKRVDVFEKEWNDWIERHRTESSPDRLRRLEQEMFLEKKLIENIWLPAFGSLDHLYPEYEVRDYNDGMRFIDLAYKPDKVRIGLESDGFLTHIKNVGRWEHANNLLRDMHLIADGWTILHLSYDVIMHRPRQAQQLLRQIVWGREGKLLNPDFTPAEREAIRFGRSMEGPLSPGDVAAYLGISNKTARMLLRNLTDKNIFRPSKSHWKRVKTYELTRQGMDIWLK